jgi:hypothetical protein
MKPQSVDHRASDVAPTDDLNEQRTSRADLDRYRAIIARVSNVGPEPGVELPPE